MQSIDFLDKGPGADWVRRRAKLFEAGDYPDKGVTVAPETLQALANGFSQPVPVLVEHAESPLQLGFLNFIINPYLTKTGLKVSFHGKPH